MQISQVLGLLNGRLVGDFDGKVKGFAPLNEATEGQLSFFGNDKYAKDFEATRASLVLVEDEAQAPVSYQGSLIVVDSVYQSVSTLLKSIESQQRIEHKGKHGTAVVNGTADVADDVYLGPQVSISADAKIGQGSQIFDQVYIGEGVTIGQNCKIHPGVKIYRGSVIGDNCIIHANTVVGSDGFGFAPDASGKLKKIPQVGKVVIESDVEIGSNCVIDRGSLKDTIIRSGVKLDNLIQIAHNVEIKESTVIAAQTGIAGSTTIGKYCMIGGQVGIVGHIELADFTSIQAQSGVNRSIKNEHTKLYGSPALDYSNYLKSYAHFRRLGDLNTKVREMEKTIFALKAKLEEGE